MLCWLCYIFGDGLLQVQKAQLVSSLLMVCMVQELSNSDAACRCLSLDGSFPWGPVPMVADTTITLTLLYGVVTALYQWTFMCQAAHQLQRA